MNKVHFALVLVALVYASVVNAATTSSPKNVDSNGNHGSNGEEKLKSNSPSDRPIANETTSTKQINENATIPVTIIPTPNSTTTTSSTTSSSTTSSTTPSSTTSSSTTPSSTTSSSTTSSSTTPSSTTPSSTTAPSTSTLSPSTTTETPPNGVSNSVFFLGGFVLGLGLLAIAYVVYKFYKNRGDLSYRTL